MIVQEGAFNQEKALVGAFSVIVKTDCETDGSSAALARGSEPAAAVDTRRGRGAPAGKLN